MSNLIDRQAAIEALADYIHNVDAVYGEGRLPNEDCIDAARSVLDELPSARPEIIRCKVCKHYSQPHGCGYIDGMVTAQEDGFCSCAERITDE